MREKRSAGVHVWDGWRRFNECFQGTSTTGINVECLEGERARMDVTFNKERRVLQRRWLQMEPSAGRASCGSIRPDVDCSRDCKALPLPGAVRKALASPVFMLEHRKQALSTLRRRCPGPGAFT